MVTEFNHNLLISRFPNSFRPIIEELNKIIFFEFTIMIMKNYNFMFEDH